MTLTATDNFAGGGGSTCGLLQAGFDVTNILNHWDTAIRTHQANHPWIKHWTENLAEFDFRLLPRTNVAWFSPSCVWHARSGGRKKPTVEEELRRDDEGAIDRATAFAVIAATEVHRYDAVIVENVVEFMGWTLYDWWLDGMRALGYKAQVVLLNSADIGPNPVAQNRIRFYAVFTRDGDVDLAMPEVTRTPATAILDPDLGKLHTNHGYVASQVEQIEVLDVPHLVTYRNHAKPWRADQHQLATVTAGGNHHGIATVTSSGVYRRMLNNRERARAQGFPDDYIWHGKNVPVIRNGKRRYIDEVRVQIGNAVSVNVARWLGERVAVALGEESPCAA